MFRASAGAEVVREAVGAFSSADAVQGAITDLAKAGFSTSEIGLLAGEHTVRQQLGDFYTRTNASAGSADAPNTAFVAKKSIGDTMHALIGSLFFAGTTLAGGVAVASAAVLGGGLVAAATGVAAVGAMGAALALIVQESDAEELEQQVDEGHLLLFVRANDERDEQKAVEILSRHTPIGVKVVSAPAAGTD